jgi:hypothetical protein
MLEAAALAAPNMKYGALLQLPKWRTDDTLKQGNRPEIWKGEVIVKLIRILTPEARQAILSASGPFYEAIIEAIMRLNPDLCEAGRAVTCEAVGELLGPKTLFEALSGTTRIEHAVDCVQVRGEQRDVLECDPIKLLRYTSKQVAWRIAFVEAFSCGEPGPGSEVDRALRKVARLRAQFIEEGGKGQDFDDYLFADFYPKWGG